MALNLPRLQRLIAIADSMGMPTGPFQIWWDQFAKEIETSFDGLSSAVATLAAMNDENILTPVEKPVWIFIYSNVLAEQTDIDTKATSYGITTEKTNYDNAVSALTTYLGTLTVPVAWNNMTGNTTVVGATFRTKFTDVFSTKQLLLNKMHNSAKTLADTADGKAVAAQTTANTAEKNDKLTVSYTDPINILTASDAGSNATIAVALHDRKYGDGTSVSLTAQNKTNLAYSTTYYLYYDDATFAATAPTIVATTSSRTAQVAVGTSRHFLGNVTTPAAGGAPIGGGSGGPPWWKTGTELD